MTRLNAFVVLCALVAAVFVSTLFLNSRPMTTAEYDLTTRGADRHNTSAQYPLAKSTLASKHTRGTKTLEDPCAFDVRAFDGRNLTQRMHSLRMYALNGGMLHHLHVRKAGGTTLRHLLRGERLCPDFPADEKQKQMRIDDLSTPNYALRPATPTVMRRLDQTWCAEDELRAFSMEECFSDKNAQGLRFTLQLLGLLAPQTAEDVRVLTQIGVSWTNATVSEEELEGARPLDILARHGRGVFFVAAVRHPVDRHVSSFWFWGPGKKELGRGGDPRKKFDERAWEQWRQTFHGNCYTGLDNWHIPNYQVAAWAAAPWQTNVNAMCDGKRDRAWLQRTTDLGDQTLLGVAQIPDHEHRRYRYTALCPRYYMPWTSPRTREKTRAQLELAKRHIVSTDFVLPTEALHKPFCLEEWVGVPGFAACDADGFTNVTARKQYSAQCPDSVRRKMEQDNWADMELYAFVQKVYECRRRAYPSMFAEYWQSVVARSE